jgi:hypothetical protein
MKKILTALIILLTLISIAFAADSHTFVVNHVFEVNKYYFSQAPQIKYRSFYIEPVLSEASLDSCHKKANYSFKLTNPMESQAFTISVTDFKGIAYIPGGLILEPGQARLIYVQLQPDCETRGTVNPFIRVETADEEAHIPLLLHVTGEEPLTEDDCLYHFDKSICDSQSYVRITQGNKYEVDLADLFYDPDGDMLKYSAVSSNIKVTIRGEKAIIKAPWHYTGAEHVTFSAEDGKGGKASSRTFYFHVVSNERGYLFNFFASNWFWVAVVLILLVVILLLLILK